MGYTKLIEEQLDSFLSKQGVTQEDIVELCLAGESTKKKYLPCYFFFLEYPQLFDTKIEQPSLAHTNMLQRDSFCFWVRSCDDRL